MIKIYRQQESISSPQCLGVILQVDGTYRKKGMKMILKSAGKRERDRELKSGVARGKWGVFLRRGVAPSTKNQTLNTEDQRL